MNLLEILAPIKGVQPAFSSLALTAMERHGIERVDIVQDIMQVICDDDSARGVMLARFPLDAGWPDYVSEIFRITSELALLRRRAQDDSDRKMMLGRAARQLARKIRST